MNYSAIGIEGALRCIETDNRMNGPEFVNREGST
jgi:hypothetical protein